jgi:acetolactate synthase-1/2/3 large subunit
MAPTDYSIDLKADFPNPTQLIRIDIDADQLSRGATPVVGMCGDAKATLLALMASDLGPARGAGDSASRGDGGALRGVGEGASKGDGGASRAAEARSAALEAVNKFSPSLRQHIGVLDLIRDTLPNALMVGDSTQLVYGGNLGFNARYPGSWFNSATGYGTLGYAVPASTGAGLAAQDRPVVCLVGDGGVQFTISELAVLRDVDAWTAVIIWNNQGYGEIRTSMLAVGIEPEGVDVRPPDFAYIARAYGYPHRRIGSRGALATALSDFGSRRQVLILEITASEFV